MIMKKTLALILFISFCASLYAGSQKQGNYRWRNDDGDMTSATWKAAENTSAQIGQDEVVRLRVELYNSTPFNFFTDYIALYYKGTNDVDFIPISNDANNAFVLSLSSFFSEADTLNDLLTNTNDLPHAGGFSIESTLLKEFTFKRDSTNEAEYCIKSTMNAEQGDTYAFKVFYGISPDDFDPDRTIELTISSGTPEVPLKSSSIFMIFALIFLVSVFKIIRK